MSDVTLAKPFVKATITVLSSLAGMDPKPGIPYVKNQTSATGDVSAIVGFTGHKKGSIAISFSRSCAISLVKAMLGDDIEDIVADTRDAVGEVSNMISGQARAGLSELGIICQGTTPSIIFGDGHTICHYGGGTVVAIPFTTEHGDFTLEFCFT